MCMESPEDKIIITHGTFTMPITAKFLGQKNIRKTIILTWAMVPANKENSDALFNIWTAVAVIQALQRLGHWVYITMNGKIFPWNDVRKNVEDGIFELEE
jgi:L-asparaginase